MNDQSAPPPPPYKPTIQTNPWITIATILTLIGFYPVGLILLWAVTKWGTKVKILLTLYSLIVGIVPVILITVIHSTRSNVNQTPQIGVNLPNLSSQTSLRDFSTIHTFYIISKDDGSLYQYNLDTSHVQKLIDGKIDVYAVAQDESVWYIKNNSLNTTKDGVNIQTILSTLQQPVETDVNLQVSPDLQFVVYATKWKQYGAGKVRHYWLVNTKTKETTAIQDNSNPSFYVTYPRWYNSHLVFQSQEDYAIGQDLWEYSFAKKQFIKYNPLQLSNDNWLNFDELYSPDKKWVEYSIFIDNNENTTKTVLTNIQNNTTIDLPKSFSSSEIMFSYDSLFLGGINFEQARDSSGFIQYNGANLSLFDLTQGKVTKTVNLSFPPLRTKFPVLLEINDNGFVYSLHYDNQKTYTITDTISSKTFTFESYPSFIGRYRGNLYVQVDNGVSILDTSTGEIHQLTSLLPVEQAFTAN